MDQTDKELPQRTITPEERAEYERKVEEISKRIKAAKTFREVMAAMKDAPLPPDLPPGYNLLEALNDERLRKGERPLIVR